MGRIGTGLEIRDKSIRVQFVYEGKTYKERVTVNGKSLEPTPANIKYATRLAADIRRRIAQGAFRLQEFFPDSPRCKEATSGPETLGQLSDLWLEAQGRLAASTQDQYATAVRFWKRLLGETRPIKDMTHKLLAAKIGGYPWPSAKTHNNYLIALRGILGLEFRGAASLHNPLNGIENMPTVKRLPDPMTIQERELILEHFRSTCDTRVYAYFLWMFYTGMRPEEAIALRWSDVDFNSQTARIQRVRTFKGSERGGSKTNMERDVDLVPQAMAALTIMKPHTFMLRVIRKDDDDTAADIFQNPVTGKPWHDERSQRDTYWRPTLKRLGIRFRKPYNTRHTYATVALMAGVPPAYIANQLGHSVKMLLDTYARWIPGNDGGSAKAMMHAAMSNSSQIHPAEFEGEKKKAVSN